MSERTCSVSAATSMAATLSAGTGGSTVTRMGCRPCSTKPCLGRASWVPSTTIGTIGTGMRLARSKAPALKARSSPVGERVPSGKIISELPSRRLASLSASIARTLAPSPRLSLM